jgi:hypothetical protein
MLFEDDGPGPGRPRWYRGAMGLMLVGMGVILAGMGAWLATLAGPGTSLTALLFLPLIAVVVILMGVLMYAQERGKRTFTIFEGGLLMPQTPLGDAIRGRERFVAWQDIDRFELEAYPLAPQARFLQVRIKGEANALLLSDNWGAMDILDRVFPAKCAPELRRSVAEIRAATSSGIAERAKTQRTSAITTILMMGGFAVMMAVMMGAFAGPGTSGGFLAVIGSMMLLVGGLFVWAMSMGERRLREATALLRSRAEPGGVVVAQTFVARLSGAKEKAIPYGAIKEVRPLVYPFFLDPYCRVVFSDGRKRDLPLEVMLACRGLPGFRDEGGRLANAAPEKLDPSPLATSPMIPVGMACAALAGSFFGGVLLSATFSGVSGGLSVWVRVAQLALLVILLPLYFVARVMMKSRTERESATAVIQWDKLILYDSQQNRTTIAFAEMREVREEEGLSGKSAKIVLKDGKEVPIPFRYAADLRHRITLMAAYPPVIAAAAPVAALQFPSPVAAPVVQATVLAPPAAPRPGDQIVPTQLRAGRGALLVREDAKTLESRKKGFFKVGAGLAAAGAACIALMATAALYAWPLGFFGWFMLFSIGLLFAALGAALVFASRRLGAVSVYENGVAVPGNVGQGEFFFPWGMISTITEQQNSIDGAYYHLVAKDGTAIALKRSIPGLDGVMPMVRDRIGRPEYAGEIEKPRMDAFQGKVGYAMLAIALGLSFGGGGYMGYSLADSFGGQGAWLLGMGLMGPLTAMLAVPYITKRVGDMAKKQNAKRGPPAGATFISLAVCAAIFFASATQAHGIVAGPEDYPRSPLPEPAGVGLPSDTMSNFSLSLGGFVVAGAGKTITLSDGTLRFASPSGPRSSGLYVSKGGTLLLRNVTVEPDGSEGWTAQVYGKAVIADSRIVKPYGDKDRENEFGGLEIYSDDVRISNSSFEGGASNLVFTADSSPLIEGSRFTGAKADAAQVHGGAPRFLNNTFEGNFWGGTLFAHTKAEFRGNRFVNNTNGLAIIRSSPTVEGNLFSGNEDRGLVWDATSEPKIGNNVHVGPHDAAERWEVSAYADACIFGGTIVVIIGFAATYLAWRSAEAELRRRREAESAPPGMPAPVPVAPPAPAIPSAAMPPAALPPPPPPPFVQCPRCRGPAELVPEHMRHYCRTCSQYA